MIFSPTLLGSMDERLSNSSARARCAQRSFSSRFLLSLVLAIACAAPAAADPLAAYSFDDGGGSTLSDVSGHGNPLDLTNGPQWVAGRYNTALSFDGSNHRAVARAYSPALDLTGSSFTLSAWINPRSNNTWQMIVLKPAHTSHTYPYFDWSLHREISTGRIVGYLGCDGGQRSSNASTPLNTWTHVAITYDGTALRHYINGVLDRSTALGCAVGNTSSQPIRIGANSSNGEVLNGSVDDVRIYNRVLLAAEIQADMNTPLYSNRPAPTPDTTVPSVVISAPANGATVNGAVTISANASDNIGVLGVQFRLDGVNLGPEDQSAPYSIAWTSSAASNGAHALTAVARDAAGNATTSNVNTVTVANTVPTATLGVTLSATPASGRAPLYGVDLTANVSGTATGNIIYTFYCNRSDSGSSVSQPWDWQISNSAQSAVSAADICNYSEPGSYTAKIIAQRGLLAAEARTLISVNPPPVAASPVPPVQTQLTANPVSVGSGGRSNLTWSSANANSCTAGGSWSGGLPTSGSASTEALFAPNNTFTLTCSGAGGSSASGSATVRVAGTATQTGLDFQGSASTTGTVRFQFLNPLAIYPATYIWKVYPRQQAGYYTTFFWGNANGRFWWDEGSPNTYYGAHPYPQPPPDGTTHKWEIATDRGGDFLSTEDVVYDRWYTQALVAWSDSAGKHTAFYWDLPDTSKVIVNLSSSSFGNLNPPVPALTWGDAPWNPSNEIMNGVIRGIQIYSTRMSISEVLAETATPLSTSPGASNVWYLNLNPTPTDISDKSGAGHHPEWVGPERPLLWTNQ